MNTHSLLAAGSILATIGFGQSAASEVPKQDTVPHYVLSPAGKVIGLDLRNDSEKNVGDIGDLIVETHSGEIRYAVLDVGGFLGVGEDHRVVPWTLIQVIPDEKDADEWHARTSLTEQQVKAAPKCKAHQRLDADLEKRMEATFGKHEDWAYSGKDEAVLAWCSQLDGVLVKDPANKEVGTVKELVLAPANDCIAYAVVNTKKEAGDKLVALPWSRLGFTYDGEKLVGSTPVETARFAAAPEYDKKDWKRMSSTAWMNELSTYYACDPFWKTSRFATAHKKPKQKP
jgi:sporulation protein YlmC with PRC-barrel domain